MLINGNALVVLAPHKNLEKIKSSMNCFRWKAGTAGGGTIFCTSIHTDQPTRELVTREME